MQARVIVLTLVATALACGESDGSVADSPSVGNSARGMRDTAPVGVVTMGLPDTGATMPSPRQLSAAEAAAWLETADSVMLVHLQRSLFTSPEGHAENLFECASDAGGDNPTTGIAAARARIISRTAPTVDWAWDYQGLDTLSQRSSLYVVELISAARMIPNWIAKVPYSNDSIPGDEAYVFEMGPRVDTVQVHLEDIGPREPRWGVCAPVRAGAAPGLGFWTFVHAERPWPRAILWRPAGGSWDRIRQLADSLGG